MNPLSSLKRLLGLTSSDDEALEGDGDDPVRPQTLASDLVAEHHDRDLDYTPESLLELDAVADELPADADAAGHGDDAGAVGTESQPTGDDEEDRNAAIRRLGAYLGETFVRSYDGEWTFDERAGWVVELPTTHHDDPLVLTIPSVLGDVVEGESSFALVHDAYVRELDVDAPELATDADATEPDDPRDEPSPPAVVAAFDQAAAALAAEHDRLDFTPASFSALDEVAAADRPRDTDRFDPDADDLAFEPDDADLAFDVGGHTDAVAGYFALVCRQHHDAAYRGELAETLVIEGATRRAELEPRTLAAAVAAQETSFATLYDDLRADLGLGDD